MATTAIWDIRGRLDHVLGYAENPEKTKNPDWGKTNSADMTDVMEEAMRQAQARGLADVIEYATEGAKTERQYFVSSINCAKQTARKEKRKMGSPHTTVTRVSRREREHRSLRTK